MVKGSLLSILLFVATILQASDYIPKDYVWTTQSKNSCESMPCGGHDIGMNVWVENGDILFYIAQSGWFDENNTLLKAGRWRLHFDNNPFDRHDFQQRLSLDQGAIYIRGGHTDVRIWVDVFNPIVFVEMKSRHAVPTTLSYESWRYKDRPVTKAECQQCSYKWIIPSDCTTYADSIEVRNNQLHFSHKNRSQTVFDFTVNREHLDDIKDQLYNPIGGREMSGKMLAPGFQFIGTSKGVYASTDYKAWNFLHQRMKKSTIQISLSNEESARAIGSQSKDSSFFILHSSLTKHFSLSKRWWHKYWQRSWIQTDGSNADVSRMVRNYELFRYMLGCNAYGQWPTKFNGGLFTFDPVYVDSTATFTPDYRKWGGGTMTAQNQRLVYWPMLKSGDTYMMESQFDTYLRLLPNAIARTKYYWGHDGASFTEQIENFGLPNPAEYGKHPEGSDYGVERNAWLEYEWDTVLEFCMMILQAQKQDYQKGYQNYQKYMPLIEQSLKFFDEHYQYQAKKLGAKALTDSGKLIIYPGSGCETYKMAYNPSSTIAALLSVSEAMKNEELRKRIPEIPLRTIEGDTCIAPAITWARIQNVETPQLYPVFPWRIYGMGRPHLEIGRNTYFKDSHALSMRSSKGWKQDNIWAACLGLTDEAQRLTLEKFADGPYRFPAFWESGFDWAPDHNRGGSAMIGLQEMVLQENPDGTPILFPAWPKEWNVSFRLHTSNGEVIEASIVNGEVIQN